ncbi:MAG: glycine reductase, partial [Symbiobacteriaceae bacterium]|nr:glycine reductase [Symbiobacteriaceae bacterium]
MENNYIKQTIGAIFSDLADALETGRLGSTLKVAVTVLGSEHGADEIIRGALLAAKQNPELEICLIGPANNSGLTTYEAPDEASQHQLMEELLDNGVIAACVTMHYNFP